MIADLPASERAYQHIKQCILSGRIAPGPLDLGLLADGLRMSVTPVREALARLSAERLVRFSPHQGYATAPPSAARLADLYTLSGTLSHLCVQRRARSGRTDHLPLLSGSYADDMTSLLEAMASHQSNSAVSEMMWSLNDQLFSARRLEPNVFPATSEELATLVDLWTTGRVGDLRGQLKAHHRSRLLKVDVLARHLRDSSNAT